MQLIWIRHGQCPGNAEKRYIGRTDESLSMAGKEALLSCLAKGVYPAADWIIASPKKRCLESAALLYPGQKITVIPEFAECDFGAFEGKNYRELQNDANYQRWIDSGGLLPFPGGESRETFQRRCLSGMNKLAQKLQEEQKKRFLEGKTPVQTAACVVHGGTIMAVLSALAEPKRDYYDWQSQNGFGFVCDWDEKSGRLTRTAVLGKG